MITTIQTPAGQIEIISKYIGNKAANWDTKANIQTNYNNHKITVKLDKKRISFDFWGSIAHPVIDNDQDNVFALYCFLQDAIAGGESFADFCGNFGYDEDSRKAFRTFCACKRSHAKYEKLTIFDIYELTNYIQETWNC